MNLAIFWPVLAASLLPLAAAAEARESGDVAHGMVKIQTMMSPPDFTAPWQRMSPQRVSGSGFVIAGGRILTSAHLVADQVNLEIQREGAGRRVGARVEHVCEPCDLAILRVSDERILEGARPLEIGALPRPKQLVRAYGFPEGGEGLSVTEGVVSRVQFDHYAHSARRLLMMQIDAAINPGNSGGPVMADGKVIGVAMQALEGAENVGHVVPAPVIEHFLDDVRDGRFDGFPELDVYVQAIESDALRRRLGLEPEGEGVLVTAVSRRGPAHARIRPGDVLLAMDGVAIHEDNTVDLGAGLRIESTFLEQRAQVGDELTVTLLRDGVVVSERIEMRAPDPLVALGRFDRGPDYRIFGGLVFQPLTARYLTAFETPPEHLTRFLGDPRSADYAILGAEGGGEQRREIVVLSGLLASELTRGYEALEDSIVRSVDGRPIADLSDLSRALDRGTGSLVVIETEHGGLLVLDRAQAQGLLPEILGRYQVGADRSARLLAESQAPGSGTASPAAPLDVSGAR